MKQDRISEHSKRAAIYCRVSTDDQTCDRQEKDLREYAQRAGYEVIETYTEVASGARNDRKERAKVIALAQARKIDAVLVTELTRWGRSTVDLLSTVEALSSYDVSLIAQTGFDFNLSTPQGRLILTLLAGLSQFERELTAERVKSGLRSAVAKGVKLGRPRGNKTLALHKKSVKSLLTHGFSYRDIANKLKISTRTIGKIANA